MYIYSYIQGSDNIYKIKSNTRRNPIKKSIKKSDIS